MNWITDMDGPQPKAFLRIPPFPGARETTLCRPSLGSLDDLSDNQIDALIRECRALRVGGDYWAAQPKLTVEDYVLVKVHDPAVRKEVIRELGREAQVLIWTEGEMFDGQPSHRIQRLSGACDPWHVVSGAKQVVLDADDELALIAQMSGVPIRFIPHPGSGLKKETATVRERFRGRVLDSCTYVDPFTHEPTSPLEALRLCGFWRRLIDGNRDIGAAVGFAAWKRPTVAPLLWGGSGPVPFHSRVRSPDSSKGIVVWKARTPANVLKNLERSGARLIEVEDGFVRSAGLGADCVPPLSITVDHLGVHYDPSRPSELECLIAAGDSPEELLDRARQLRALLVSSGISKYGVGVAPVERRVADRVQVLVPGQVEDDQAVLCAGGSVNGNLALLRRVREEAPDAYVIYKPHPDVEAGHRRGAITDTECLEFADEIVRNEPISALIDMVDELHVISSLAGFEALIRKKKVTTYGVPFYAGWGLTRDLGPVPTRRKARRTIDELVAAVLLLYPRYLDPTTGLPCPPEVLVRRISEAGGVKGAGVVVQLRRLQGRWRKRFARMGLG